jgi:uncharacterized YccA/Bax inhibitor family protein
MGNNPDAYATSVEDAATKKGVALKTLYFAMLTTLSALLTYLFIINSVLNETLTVGLLVGLLIGSSLLSFICAIVCMFSVKAVPYAGSLYAVSQGFLLGFISLIAELAYPGIAFTALFATIGVFLIMAVLYYTGIIKVTNKFRSFMFSAIIGIIFTQLMLFLMSLFIPSLATVLYGTGPLAIIISVIMVAVAALMILINLNNIDLMVNNGLNKKYEWLGAFGLIITLIWLYLEILNLLMRLKARR